MPGFAFGGEMGRRHDLIEACASDLEVKCGMLPEPDLLDRVIKACGPAAFAAEGATIDPEDRAERESIRSHFLVRKLGLRESPDLAEAVNAALEAYPGKGEPRYRPVIYYLLVKYFGREDSL